MPESDVNRAFCAVLLLKALDMLTLEEKRSFKSRDTGLTWSGPRWNRHYFFEWLKHDGRDRLGETYVWEGQADNAHDARYKALSNWLDRHAEGFRRQPKP